MIQKKYGDIMPSLDEDYSKIALSFLNIFDNDTAQKIQHSKWFQVILEYRIPIYILYEELKAIKSIMTPRVAIEDIIATISKITLWDKYTRYDLYNTPLPSMYPEQYFWLIDVSHAVELMKFHKN